MRARILTSSSSISIKMVSYIIITRKLHIKKKNNYLSIHSFIPSLTHSCNFYLLPDTEYIVVNKTDLVTTAYIMLRLDIVTNIKGYRYKSNTHNYKYQL